MGGSSEGMYLKVKRFFFFFFLSP